jgi:hypothetical protein
VSVGDICLVLRVSFHGQGPKEVQRG